MRREGEVRWMRGMRREVDEEGGGGEVDEEGGGGEVDERDEEGGREARWMSRREREARWNERDEEGGETRWEGKTRR